MRVDLKSCNTRTQKVTHFIEEYLEFDMNYVIWSGAYWADDMNLFPDEKEADKLVKLSLQECTYYNWTKKVKRSAILSVEKYFSADDDCWCIQLHGHVCVSISLETEAEAEEIYRLFDNWIFG